MATHNLIQTVTVGSGGAASIAFTSIPQTYTDLQLLVSARSNRTTADAPDDDILARFNSSTSNYSVRALRGDGSAAASVTGSPNTALSRMTMPSSSVISTANVFGSLSMYIPNYTSANQKSVSIDVVMEANFTFSYMFLIAGLWADTSAITNIGLTPASGPLFVQYSSASLYGISKT